MIEKDAALLEKLGVKVFYGREVTSVAELQEEYDAVILAVGAYKRGQLKLDGKEVRNALEFLEEFNRAKGKVNLGKRVVVIGGGNTAMDTARAAKRNAGVEKVSLVYRRTRRYMPADEEELVMAIEDGVELQSFSLRSVRKTVYSSVKRWFWAILMPAAAEALLRQMRS